jgi:probable rRNA maturation factor
MAIRISCENINTKRPISLDEAKKTVSAVLKGLGVSNAELNIVFVGDRTIRSLNKRYLNSDRPTDVIAFQTDAGEGFLGDIAISSDTAARNAREYGFSFNKEIKLLLIHGTLHLMGYEDVTEKGQRSMRKKEDEYLQETARFLQ